MIGVFMGFYATEQTSEALRDGLRLKGFRRAAGV